MHQSCGGGGHTLLVSGNGIPLPIAEINDLVTTRDLPRNDIIAIKKIDIHAHNQSGHRERMSVDGSA